MKSTVQTHKRQKSANRPRAHTRTISGAPLHCPISISGSITSLICDRNTHYSYDNNGNVIEEREGGPSAEASAGVSTLVKDEALRSVNRGFALIRNPDESEETVAMRSYEWDEENRLTGYADRRVNMAYVYDADNQRTVKYHIQAGEETLYFDQFWQGVNEDSDFRQSKHIYLGETRIATRLNLESRNGSTDSSYELVNTYYYHPDHLGSAQFVSDRDGGQYEHMEYTPYGELWEEQVSDSYDMIPFRFTAKEWDSETELYYYGARYLDPKRGRWMSADPAGAELMNPMERNREGKLVQKKDYSLIEAFNWYSYVSNNPIKYVDPTGLDTWYFGLVAQIDIPFLNFIKPNLPNEISSALGLYYDTDDKSFGWYNVNSYGQSVIPDVQAGFEIGVTELEADDYFSRSTGTIETSIIFSESLVIDDETGEVIATESGLSVSALGLKLTSVFGKIAETFFGFDLSGRQDFATNQELIDLSGDD
ncbi:RHS repeat-associated core domain-containing protein [Marispirochaeta sp.]|uniref:RHS repeat domain-containing protein n=1 Tax=Marispirochaeta sp. TaxID=2038653 RepID=UPI0029C8A004|nr:RHS repeat-associated core domain-containing protein [Marispirochaeta sp.]